MLLIGHCEAGMRSTRLVKELANCLCTVGVNGWNRAR